MSKYVLTPEADQDLAEIWEYVAQDDCEAADRWDACIVRCENRRSFLCFRECPCLLLTPPAGAGVHAVSPVPQARAWGYRLSPAPRALRRHNAQLRGTTRYEIARRILHACLESARGTHTKGPNRFPRSLLARRSLPDRIPPPQRTRRSPRSNTRLAPYSTVLAEQDGRRLNSAAHLRHTTLPCLV